MKSRDIDLPEPARRIWKDATTLVDALLGECKTLEHERWYLGGGTALAADWGHRTSTDIDILIERDFHARGIARHLMLHNISARQVIHDARKAMKQSVEQTVVHTTREQTYHR